ncbi:MAG: 4'-phosphopantetheinyl transferase superfamily protein [Flavobacterium sp.]|nr:4'-phosphopantetheinyl transferase superfamily protein [Flavobacterium sp.]
MPLYQNNFIENASQILVWKITESYEQLFESVQLKEKSLVRLRSMKSELHQRAFLSVRMLLKIAGYSDFELHYDSSGKPHLEDEKYISISHSHEFSTIIISSQKVGIDIEMQREKIIKIASKFCHSEFNFLPKNFKSEKEEYIKNLTLIWGTKEAIFKIVNVAGVSFKNHIQANPFKNESQKTTALLEIDSIKQEFDIYYDEITSIENKRKFSLVYAFEKHKAQKT